MTQLGDLDTISKEVKVPCKIKGRQGESAYLVLDGQYVKCINTEDARIAGPLPVNSLTVYEEGNLLELVDKGAKTEFFSLYIEDTLHQYVSNEIKARKLWSMDV